MRAGERRLVGTDAPAVLTPRTAHAMTRLLAFDLTLDLAALLALLGLFLDLRPLGVVSLDLAFALFLAVESILNVAALGALQFTMALHWNAPYQAVY